MDFCEAFFDAARPASDSDGPTTQHGFEFTVSNGQVMAMEGVIGANTFNIHVPSNATFALGTNMVTETITGTNATDVIQYTAETGNNAFYQVSQDTVTFTNPSTTDSNGHTFGYAFTISNGAVTAEQETFGNASHTTTFNVRLSPGAVFSTGNGTVTETLAHGNSVETIRYVQPSGSTLYAVASETTTFIQPGTATTALSVNPCDRAEFTIATGTVTQVQSVSPNGTATTVTPNSHTTFTQLAQGFVEETTTFGSHSAYTVFYAGSGSGGVYTEVAHGSGTTVDLVGLQAQLGEMTGSRSECRPFARFALHIDGPVMGLHDAVGYGQAQAG